MNPADLLPLLPLLVLAATPVVLLVLLAFYRNHRLTAIVSMAGLTTAFVLLLAVARMDLPRQITALVMIDGFSLFFIGLILAAAFVTIVLAYGYLETYEGQREELYVLLLLATLGSAVLTSSTHFASFFVALELLSVSLYALIAYRRSNLLSIEAGVKYLVLAATSSAFLLFGMAIIYTDLGTMQLASLASLQASGQTYNVLLLTGLAMILVGVGFKLALVPFHLWTPDVYEGAPVPVTAFVATVSKGGMFALLLRYFTTLDVPTGGAMVHSVAGLLTAVAVASMFTGNLLALLQNNLKRLLAYSSIANLGYLLVTVLASGSLAVQAASYFLAAYFVTMLGALGVITVLSRADREADMLDDYQGLVWRRPLLAGVFTAMLLSLAGIPLTAGFIGKFYLLAAGVGSNLWLLVIALVVNSGIGLFYYLRIVVVLYKRPSEAGAALEVSAVPGQPVLTAALPGGSVAVLAVLTVLLLWLGVWPASLISVIQAAVPTLTP